MSCDVVGFFNLIGLYVEVCLFHYPISNINVPEIIINNIEISVFLLSFIFFIFLVKRKN